MDSLASAHKAVGSQVVLAGMLFKVLLDIQYIYQISPAYSYMGMTLSLDYQKIVESYLTTVVLLLIVSLRARTPSTIILIVGLFCGVIPLLSFYGLQNRSPAFTYVSVLAFVLSIVTASLPRARVWYIKVAASTFVTVCVIFVSIVVGMLFLQGAYKHFTFDFYSVYEYRSELSDLAFVGPFKYATDWAFSVFSITLLIWSLYHRKKIIALFAICSQIFMYGSILMKAILFNLPFVVLIYYMVRRRGNIVEFGWMMCGILLIGIGEAWLLGQSDVTALITRRVLAMPAYLANEYFELFGDIGYVYWTNGILGSWAPYPFAADPPRLVGEFAMGSSNTWANNGMFGMGFMQAGFVGMLLYGVLYGFWLYLIDCIAVGRVPVEVAVSMVIVPTALVVTDSDLLTGLLTHGGIAATLMLWLWAGMVPARRPGYEQPMRLASQAPTPNRRLLDGAVSGAGRQAR